MGLRNQEKLQLPVETMPKTLLVENSFSAFLADITDTSAPFTYSNKMEAPPTQQATDAPLPSTNAEAASHCHST